MAEDAARLVEGTRGAVLARLRCGDRTVEELARNLGLTPNAIRLHLQRLERDGFVVVRGNRRQEGVGKPALLYGTSAAADQRFSRAYAPLLAALFEVLSDRLEPGDVEALAREAGQRLAAGLGGVGSAGTEEAIGRILRDLGGEAEFSRRGGELVVEGCGCPLAEVTRGRPAACRAMEALLSSAIGRPVTEACSRGARPRCRFLVDLEVDGAA
jgi:predicted ArsR family transcriptional regulator